MAPTLERGRLTAPVSLDPSLRQPPTAVVLRKKTFLTGQRKEGPVLYLTQPLRMRASRPIVPARWVRGVAVHGFQALIYVLPENR